MKASIAVASATVALSVAEIDLARLPMLAGAAARLAAVSLRLKVILERLLELASATVSWVVILTALLNSELGAALMLAEESLML